jgi:sterol desaturase/sphingolipid hydroxylase (fatty acid hydroxylase superfamily)
MHPAETTYQLARGSSAAVALLLALALERYRRHERLRPAWATNLGLFAVDGVVTGVACGACGWTVAAWAASHDLGLLAGSRAPLWLVICVGIAGLDAVSWLWHAANHRVRLLWRFHQVHHADTSFHATTAFRFHPCELLLALPVRLAAVAALGVPAAGVLAFEVAFAISNVLEHGNFDLPRALDRCLQRVFVTPSVHRAHHVSDWHELDTNFGTIFSLWDRMARTFRAGDPGRRVATGLPDWQRPDAPSLFQSLWLPFAARRGRPR